MPIEIAWTAAPTMIVFFLVLVTTRTLWEVEADPPQPARRRQRAVRHRDRPSVVVGIRLRNLRRPEARLHHRQRAAHSGERRRHAAAGVPDAQVGRRLPQLLGAAAGRQDRPDSRPHQSCSCSRPTKPACTSASAPSTAARSTPTCCFAWSSIRRTSSKRWLANEVAAGRRRPGGPRRQGGVSRRSRASIATASAARRPRGNYAPDLTHLMSRETLASGMIAEHARESCATGSAIRRRSSPAA